MNNIVLNLKNGGFEVLSLDMEEATLRAFELFTEGKVTTEEVCLKFGYNQEGFVG